MDKKISDFIIFCIEIYKYEKKINGEEVYKIFENYGLLKYLSDGYDILHTQGEKWLLEDMNEFLKERGYMQK